MTRLGYIIFVLVFIPFIHSLAEVNSFTKKDYNQRTNLKPCKLYKDDLFTLVDKIKNSFHDSENANFDIKTELPGFTVSSDKLEDFLKEKELPQTLDNLYISASGRDKHNNFRNLYLYFSYSSIGLNVSGEDILWVNGTYSVLKSYLETKRPWWWFINKIFPFISGAIPMLCLYLLAYFIKNDRKFFSISTLIFLVVFIIGVVYYFKGKFLPYTQIVLVPGKSIEYYWTPVGVIVGLLTLIVAIIGVIYTIKSVRIKTS